jgi:hypothetical protein
VPAGLEYVSSLTFESKTTWCRLLRCQNCVPWTIPSTGRNLRGITHTVLPGANQYLIELAQTGFKSVIIDLCFLSAFGEYMKFNFISSIFCTNLMKTFQSTDTLDCNFFSIDHGEGMSKWDMVTAVLWNPFHQFILPTTYVAFLADICSSLSLYNFSSFFVSSYKRWSINCCIFQTMTLGRCLYLDVLVPPSSSIPSDTYFLFTQITSDVLPGDFSYIV